MIVKQWRKRAENVEEGLRSLRLRINYFSNATFTIWLLKKKVQLNSVSFSLCSCAFRRGRKFALKIDYVSILLVWEVDLSALSGVIYLHSIARFLFYHTVIFIWHSRKRHRNFQGIPNFGSSRKTRISKTFAKHRGVLSKFVLWRPPREYKWPILNFPREYQGMLSSASANNRAYAA